VFRIARAEWSQGRRCQALGSWGLGSWRGWDNWVKGGGGKQGQFTSNLRRRRTIPVTAGGCQVSGNGVQGKSARGARGGSKGSKGKCAMYICNYSVNDGTLNDAIIVYI
jgi:hypothetical protein